MTTSPPGGRRRRALRLIGRSALLLVVGAALAALAGEAYLRLTVPFMVSTVPNEFVPNVGYVRTPNTEIRFTNRLDFWTVSRTNSLGFLDREPPSPERAAATCHVSVIGDSFVEALQIPIDDKFHVRLEGLAADRLPHLDITTSAFGIGATGQVQQLPFYDEYARRLHPKLLVLVFVANDLPDNTPVIGGLGRSGRKKKLTVGRRSDGTLELAWFLPGEGSPRPPASWAARAAEKAVERSWLALWLRAKKNALFPRPDHRDRRFTENVEALRRQPGYAALLEGWRPTRRLDILRVFARRDLPPFFEDALEYTRFALEQFKERADRDGANLVILASHTLKTRGARMFERTSEMAAALGIPVIDQAGYILRQGARLTDAQWPHDGHWSPAGHQWAAEALLEYIEQRPEVCNRPTGVGALHVLPRWSSGRIIRGGRRI